MKPFWLKDLLILTALLLLTVGVSWLIYEGYSHQKAVKEGKPDQMTLSIEKELKDLIKKQIQRDSEIVRSRKVAIAMNTIRERLEASMTEHPYQIEIMVIDNPTVNAFTLPGGLIVVYSGLIQASDNPEQVCSVIAHEMGHVAHRDSMNRLVRQFGLSAVLAMGGGGNSAQFIKNIIQEGIDNQFSQKQEEAADQYACDLLTKAKISPVHFADFFKKLEKEEKKIVNKELLRYISTHPLTAERIKRAEQAAKLFKGPEKLFHIAWAPVQHSFKSLFE